MLTAPAEPGAYELRYILGRDVDRRPILTVPVDVGGTGPATGVAAAAPAAASLVPTTFSAETGGYELKVTWSAVPVEGQNLLAEAWAMQEGIIGPVTEQFLPGQYEVRGDAGDSVFADRVTITAAGPNQFVIPVSAALSPAGEDVDVVDGHRCDGPQSCAVVDPIGIAFALPAGWTTEAPYLYETAGGAMAEAPTVTFIGPAGGSLVLNPVRWTADSGTCTTSPLGDLCIVGPPDATSLAALAVILPSLTRQ